MIDEKEIRMKKKDYLKGIKDAVGGNRHYILELLEIFVKDLPQTLDRLQELYNTNRFEEIQHVAHRVKSTLLWMSLDKAAVVAAELEKCSRELRHKDEMKFHLNDFVEECREPLEHLTAIRNDLRSKLNAGASKTA